MKAVREAEHRLAQHDHAAVAQRRVRKVCILGEGVSEKRREEESEQRMQEPRMVTVERVIENRNGNTAETEGVAPYGDLVERAVATDALRHRRYSVLRRKEHVSGREIEQNP